MRSVRYRSDGPPYRIIPKLKTSPHRAPVTLHESRRYCILLHDILDTTISAGSQNERSQHNDKKIHDNLVREVRHQLLPYYSVFDNPFYKVDGDKVTLLGQVVRPTLKTDAENAVKQIEGVSAVDNQIQVLPVSPMDDQLRRAVYRPIYGDPVSSRYGMSELPSIHIIENNGNVTLEGVADSESEKTWPISGLVASRTSSL